MNDILKAWIGKKVAVTIRSTMPVTMRGMLVAGDDRFLELDRSESGHMLIPIASILHVTVEGEEEVARG